MKILPRHENTTKKLNYILEMKILPRNENSTQKGKKQLRKFCLEIEKNYNNAFGNEAKT